MGSVNRVEYEYQFLEIGITLNVAGQKITDVNLVYPLILTGNGNLEKLILKL